MVPVSSTRKKLQEARLPENRATLLRRENKIKEAQRREKLLDQQNRSQLVEKLHQAEVTPRHGREHYAELAIIKAEAKIDEARILAEDDDQLLGDVVEEHQSLVCDRVVTSPEEKVK